MARAVSEKVVPVAVATERGAAVHLVGDDAAAAGVGRGREREAGFALVGVALAASPAGTVGGVMSYWMRFTASGPRVAGLVDGDDVYEYEASVVIRAVLEARRGRTAARGRRASPPRKMS